MKWPAGWARRHNTWRYELKAQTLNLLLKIMAILDLAIKALVILLR
jgi:hypothetical protein